MAPSTHVAAARLWTPACRRTAALLGQALGLRTPLILRASIFTKGNGPHGMKMCWWFDRLNRIGVRC